MNWLWVIFLLTGGVVGWVAKAVVGHIIEDEPGTRLDRIPFAILALAAARLPREFRDHLVAEWRTELQFILRKTEGGPLTRLRRGSRYAVGLLISAPAVADGLRGDTRRVLRAARIIGAAAAISCAAWVSILSYDCLDVTTTVFYTLVPQVPAGRTLLYAPHLYIPHPASSGMMLAASDAAGAAALLCLAAWLATTWRPLVYLGGATCVAAEILHFLGGGGTLYFFVAAAVFCIVFAIAAHQLTGRPPARRATAPPGGGDTQQAECQAGGS